MERVIKFRAWTEYEPDITEGAKRGEMEYDVQNVWSVHGRSFGHILQDRGVTLMQFTGLHDKNGKEIYEGDVIRIKSQLTDRITTDQIFWERDGFKTKRGGQIPSEKRIEVIGNIYEHPELLK